MGGSQPVRDVRLLQMGQRVGAARVEAQKVLDVVLLAVMLHHERSRGHYRRRGCRCDVAVSAAVVVSREWCSRVHAGDGRPRGTTSGKRFGGVHQTRIKTTVGRRAAAAKQRQSRDKLTAAAAAARPADERSFGGCKMRRRCGTSVRRRRQRVVDEREPAKGSNCVVSADGLGTPRNVVIVIIIIYVRYVIDDRLRSWFVTFYLLSHAAEHEHRGGGPARKTTRV